MLGFRTLAPLAPVATVQVTAITPAHATLVLTSAGVADGFALTTFVSGYNFGTTYGPLSLGILPNGNDITGSLGTNKIYTFSDVGGQTLGSALSGVRYTNVTGNPNCTGVIAGGKFSGDVFVNNNDGTVGLLDPISCGDFVSPDTSNGTLFLSQYEEVARLSCGAGCSIGTPLASASAPERASVALYGLGFLTLALLRHRRSV